MGKDYYKNESKAFKRSASTLASASTQDSEPSNKVKKDKKKKNWQSKRDFRERKDSSTLASGVNAAEVGGGEQKRKNKKDISRVTCYNCNKKGHFSNKYTELPKN